MEGSVAEFKIGKATVRIHPGKLSEEERKVVIKDATEKFLKAVQQQRKKSANQKSAQA